MGTLARNGSKYVKAFREVGDTLIIILSSLSPYAISKKSLSLTFETLMVSLFTQFVCDPSL